MRITRKPDQRLAIEKLAMRISDMALGKHEIEIAGILHLVEHRRQRHRQFQINQRMEANEIFQNPCQPVGDHIFRHTEPQPPAQPAFSEKRQDLTIEIKHATRITDKRLAIGGQPHLMRVAKHQLTSQRLLQPLDMLRHGRLPHTEPCRSLGKTAGLLQHEKAVEVMKVQHRYCTS
ncbi:hypothetical protein D3C73_908570 [compost metagenome]